MHLEAVSASSSVHMQVETSVQTELTSCSIDNKDKKYNALYAKSYRQKKSLEKEIIGLHQTISHLQEQLKDSLHLVARYQLNFGPLES